MPSFWRESAAVPEVQAGHEELVGADTDQCNSGISPCALERVSTAFRRLALEPEGRELSAGDRHEQPLDQNVSPECDLLDAVAIRGSGHDSSGTVWDTLIRKGCSPPWEQTLCDAPQSPAAGDTTQMLRSQSTASMRPLQSRQASVASRRVDVAKAPKACARKLPKPLRLDTSALEKKSRPPYLQSLASVSAPLQRSFEQNAAEMRISSPCSRASRYRLSRIPPAYRKSSYVDSVPAKHGPCSPCTPAQSTWPESRPGTVDYKVSQDPDRIFEGSPASSSSQGLASPAQKKELLAALGHDLLSSSPVKACGSQPDTSFSPQAGEGLSPVSLEPQHGHTRAMHRIVEQVQHAQGDIDSGPNLVKPPSKPWIWEGGITDTRHPSTKSHRLRAIEEEITRLYSEWVVVAHSP